MMRNLVPLLLLCATLAAREAPGEDRLPMMQVLLRYARALSARDVAAYRAVTEPGASLGLPRFSLWPAEAVEHQYFGTARWSGARINCTLAPRTFRPLADDTVLVDGLFAHVGRASHRMLGDAGQFLAVLRKSGGAWKVAAMRMAGGPDFHSGRGLDPAFVAAHDVPVNTAAGWITLFDGVSSKGWHASGGGPFPNNWKIEDGCLKALPDKAPVPASILTRGLFTDFELQFEWKLFAGSNSGVKYRLLQEVPLEGGWYDVASEYQLIDDSGEAGARMPPDGRTGSLYDVLAPSKAASRKLGEWNQSRLVVRDGHITHWLNGEKVLEYDVDQDFASPLLLQNHGTEAWFRNIRIQPQ
ncbi:MAG: DUF1080 domain-containing protein [Acidobacteria bacterium]|nr:DUF1080 domain-containing protein [Acidobacteriota bacterium]